MNDISANHNIFINKICWICAIRQNSTNFSRTQENIVWTYLFKKGIYLDLIGQIQIL